MPRPQATRVTPAPAGQLSPIVQRQAQSVVATPVVTEGMPDSNTKLRQLAEGLTRYQPNISKFLYALDDKDQEAELAKGKLARQRGDSPQAEASAAFVKGYMTMDGYARAQEDGNAFREAYSTEFDREGGDFDQWARKWWGERARGVEQDRDFLMGYQDPMTKHIEDTRKEHLEYQAGQAVARQRSNALSLMDGEVRKVTDSGSLLSPEYVDILRKGVQRLYKVDNKEFDSMMFSTLKRLGDEGNPTVWEYTRKPRPDGTPGLYNNPAWKEKIDAAEIHARDVYLKNKERVGKELEKDREDRVEALVNPIINAAARGDYDSASLAYASLLQDDHNPLNAKEVAQWKETLDGLRVKREETPEQEQNASQALLAIYSGKVTSERAVASMAHSGAITWPKAQQLIEDVKSARAEREKDSGGESAFERKLKSPEVRHAEEAIKGLLNTEAVPFDSPSRGVLKQQQTVALTEMYKGLKSGAITPENIGEWVEKTANRYVRYRKTLLEGSISDDDTRGLKAPVRHVTGADERAAEEIKAGTVSPALKKKRAHRYALEALEKDKSLSHEEWKREFNRINDYYK